MQKALKNNLKTVIFTFFCLTIAPFAYAQKEDATGITFDFEDVEIKDLVRFMAETTSTNFIVDSNVKGKVTVISPNTLDKNQALEVFETLLVSNGFTITDTKTKGVFRIVRQGESVKTPVELIKNKTYKRPSQLVTETINLTYANIEDILPILKPLLSGQANLATYQPSNMVILTETHANLQRIKKIIARIDQPIDSRGNITLIELAHADAIQVAGIVDRIFSARRLPKGAQKVEVIPEASNNRLLVVADRAQLNEIVDLVSKLDNDASNEVRSVEIVYLRHANAKDLEGVIEKIIENAEEAKDDTTEEEKDSSIIANTTFRSNISVVADESINALVISAEPSDMVTLKEVIESLDIRRLQVYIEALIMEVSEDISDQFGVEWRSADDFTSGSGISAFGGQNLSGNINSLASNPLALPSGMTFGVVGPKLTYQGEEYANIGFLVNALKSNSNINVLATPQLMTLDNEEASIVVGDNVPFITGSYTNPGDGSSNPFQTIERQDVGLTLEIKPQISENGFVRLNIYQEISSVAPQGEASDLITRKRSLKTTVVVPNQSMLALGGLIREDVTETHSRVPCLSNIWGVGEFFKSSSIANTKTNLMVFIRPVIINTYGDAETITHRKYLKMRTLQLGRERKGSKLVPAHTLPESEAVPSDMRYTPEQYMEDKENGVLEEKLRPQLPQLPKKEIKKVPSSKQTAVLKQTKPTLTTFVPDDMLNTIEPAAGPSTDDMLNVPYVSEDKLYADALKTSSVKAPSVENKTTETEGVQ